MYFIILQAVTNFVMYKFGSLKQAEWQMMYDLAKMFLYCFNHWKLETPSVHTKSTPSDDQRLYKENYIRSGNHTYLPYNLHAVYAVFCLHVYRNQIVFIQLTCTYNVVHGMILGKAHTVHVLYCV